MKRRIIIIAIMLLAASAFCLWAGGTKEQTETATSASTSAETVTSASTTAETVTSASTRPEMGNPPDGTMGTPPSGGMGMGMGTQSDITALDTGIDTTDQFSKRDSNTEYTESECTVIDLTKSSTITSEGTYIIRGSLSEGQLTVSAPDTAKVQIILDGCSISSSSGPALNILTADKVFLTLASGSSSSLSSSADAAILAECDLTINGEGALSLKSAASAVDAKDDLAITGGTLSIVSTEHGLEANDSIRILDGTITIDSEKDGLHCSNDEDTTKGYIYIAGGTLNIKAASDGMDSSKAVLVTGGTISIECEEGLEGPIVAVEGGEITINSTDDGLNASSGSSTSSDPMAGDSTLQIRISGGNLVVNASGDGLDSNGSLLVTGGTTIVYGPTNDGNSALDFGTSAKITGGTVIAIGTSGMAQNFGTYSTQGAILAASASSQKAGSAITLTSSDGTVLAQTTALKQYNSVLVSSPGITEGATYTLAMGTETQSIEMTSLIYSASGSGMRSMGDRGGQRMTLPQN